MGDRIKDGGQAFPVPEQRAFDGAGLCEGSPGMSLRDYFAGQALVGSLANPEVATLVSLDHEFTAKLCYLMADAMLSARTNGGGDG